MKMTSKEQPFLYFNFTDDQGIIKPLQFYNPVKLLVAHSIDEVLPCLHQVQQAVDDGYYAAGYIGYEAAPAFNEHYQVNELNNTPLLWFGIFKEPTNEALQTSNPFHAEPWQPSVSIDTYYKNIDSIQQFIAEGQTKQVNYTFHLNSTFSGDSFAYYKQLEQAQSANYAAYIHTGDFTILSASPELFFRIKDEKLITKPMKGTINRGLTYEEDLQQAAWLQNSKKNRTENQLIVDLMCEDLKRLAKPNSIRIPTLFDIEKYPTVYQMTSTVTADLSADTSLLDILMVLFPSGSITGIPRDTTMDIITELETKPRDVYCGTIGFITPQHEAVFNVPIRTVLINNNDHSMQFGVGGAITSSSNKEEEYEEVVTKAKLLTKQIESFQLIETFGLKDGHYLVFDNHLRRLRNSADYFDFPIDEQAIKNALQKKAIQYPYGQWKVRLLLQVNGDRTIDIDKLTPTIHTVDIVLARGPIKKDNLFLYHKTTNRVVYAEHKKTAINYFDVLLWNEDQEVTEFTTGNIVVEQDGVFITPPIECGLLPGTYREELVHKGIVIEQKVMINDLEQFDHIWFVNSVREWLPVHLSTE